VVPAASVDLLSGARLDWSEEGDGGLVIVNPTRLHEVQGLRRWEIFQGIWPSGCSQCSKSR